jgi:DNA-binding NarL/FixJ family response regulator
MQILVVEDHEPTRTRLVSLLDGQKGHRVTAAVGSAEQALEVIESDPPDLTILDLGLPGLSGVDAIKAVQTRCPSAEILVFTVMDDDDQVFAALRAGASGYLLKDAKPAEIISAIEELKAGGSPMSFSIARKVLKEFQGLPRQNGLDGHISPLSPRETDILDFLYRGDSYKEIADKLSLSIHTVHSHLKNIYVKLHVNSRAQAIYEAFRKNIIRQ